jgi:hypothetical protein
VNLFDQVQHPTRAVVAPSVTVLPAGQATASTPAAPSSSWLVPLGLAAVAGALFAATVWWVPRAAAGEAAR